MTESPDAPLGLVPGVLLPARRCARPDGPAISCSHGSTATSVSGTHGYLAAWAVSGLILVADRGFPSMM